MSMICCSSSRQVLELTVLCAKAVNTVDRRALTDGNQILLDIV